MSAWKTMGSAPEDGTMFLAYGEHGYAVLYYEDGCFWTVDIGYSPGSFTHWMPLPEPPHD